MTVRTVDELDTAIDARISTGTVAAGSGVTSTDVEAGPVPALLIAETMHAYLVPFVRPVTVTGLASPPFVTTPGWHVTV
jgi:hypothetical protein